MKRILTAAALALLSSTAALADNNTTQLYTGGYWSAYHVARNGAGEPMCGVSGSWTFAGGVKGWLTMKYSNETDCSCTSARTVGRSSPNSLCLWRSRLTPGIAKALAYRPQVPRLAGRSSKAASRLMLHRASSKTLPTRR